MLEIGQFHLENPQNFDIDIGSNTAKMLRLVRVSYFFSYSYTKNSDQVLT